MVIFLDFQKTVRKLSPTTFWTNLTAFRSQSHVWRRDFLKQHFGIAAAVHERHPGGTLKPRHESLGDGKKHGVPDMSPKSSYVVVENLEGRDPCPNFRFVLFGKRNLRCIGTVHLPAIGSLLHLSRMQFEDGCNLIGGESFVKFNQPKLQYP